ncbi:A/G-specific DNA-adenine glycosylase [Methylophaga lonarensis MPL]|uniref:Adenine DNA glycosylase n=1 Tax=Methylophaga lonarensis MPL TaxID=1286106 RepID=M7NY51_9GAMM|nr:A/G-specific adenine glycosylase [Methylophaga lonarensis]EMR12177.1 A/G-specific DNA-adenine glycosylase [Methylophaga lonarensis MPL]
MMTIFNFSDALLGWYEKHGRKDLPWQQSVTPYRVWVSEIMLQQTQVSTVIPYYQRFMQRFPDIAALATANLDEVLSYWAGLGYYARGRNLHKSANIIHHQLGGELPEDIEQLQTLPGIGRSTAGAIMALAFHQRYAILDGNVKRVLSRFYAVEDWPGKPQVEKQLWLRAQALLPDKDFAKYTQAQMDLGATLCTRSRPDCQNCPLQTHCAAYAQNNVSDYPRPRPKKTVPVKQVQWLVVENKHQEILLLKRPAMGIWGGLWCFPEFTDSELETVCDRLEIPVTDAQILAGFQHTFTHFKLNIQPFKMALDDAFSVIEDKPDRIWVKIKDIEELALPAPVKALVNQL